MRLIYSSLNKVGLIISMWVQSTEVFSNAALNAWTTYITQKISNFFKGDRTPPRISWLSAKNFLCKKFNSVSLKSQQLFTIIYFSSFLIHFFLTYFHIHRHDWNWQNVSVDWARLQMIWKYTSTKSCYYFLFTQSYSNNSLAQENWANTHH